MRDIAITLLVFASIPYIFSRPYIGILVWSWLGYMNPHRLSYGFAYDFPFAQVIAIVTLLAIAFSKEKKIFPWSKITIVWLMLVVWMNVTTLFALNPVSAHSEWGRTMKIQLIIFLTLLMINSKHKLNLLILVIVLSLGFFGIKGGVFSILSGGGFRVWGPPGSFIEDNNTLALALIMILPLFKYLQTLATNKILNLAAYGGMGLMSLSILTSQSRGAFLAGGAITVFLVLKSKHRIWMGLVMSALVAGLLNFMPANWFDRMNTISEYEGDSSAQGRINAWWFGFNLALDRPLVGGGFQTYTPDLFLEYAPDPDDFHDAHSIYFEMLGEQGFVGLLLFLLLGYFTYSTGRWIIRRTKKIPDLLWASNLASMLQVCLIGYAVGGAFLGLAYFDLIYHLVSIMVILKVLVDKELKQLENSGGEVEVINSVNPYSDYRYDSSRNIRDG